MALLFKSNQAFQGDPNLLPSLDAPAPANSAVYADFRLRQFISKLKGDTIRSGNLQDVLYWDTLTPSDSRSHSRSYVAADGNIALESNPLSVLYTYDPITRDSEGLRVHGSVTNTFTDPIDLGASSWVATGGTSKKNFDNWCSLAIGGDGRHYIETTVSGITNKNNTQIAVDIKSGSARYVSISVVDPSKADDTTQTIYAVFDAKTGSIVGRGMGIDSAYINRTGGGGTAYRAQLWFVSPSDAASGMKVRIGVVSKPTEHPYAGFTSSGGVVYVRYALCAAAFGVDMFTDGSIRYSAAEVGESQFNLTATSNAAFYISGKAPNTPRNAKIFSLLGDGNNYVEFGYASSTTSSKGHFLGIDYNNGSQEGTFDIENDIWSSGKDIQLLVIVRAGKVFIYTGGDDGLIDTGLTLGENASPESGKSPIRILIGRGHTTSADAWSSTIGKFVFWNDYEMSDDEAVSVFEQLEY